MTLVKETVTSKDVWKEFLENLVTRWVRISPESPKLTFQSILESGTSQVLED